MAHVEGTRQNRTSLADAVRTRMSLVPADGVVEILCGLIDEVGLSQRYLSGVTGIKRTRVQRILHADPEQRALMTIDEVEALKAALSVDDYDIAVELEFRRRNLDNSGDIPQRKGIIKGILRGLPSELIDEMDLICEIDYDEVTPELTLNLQKILAKCAGRSLKSFKRVCDRHNQERSDPFRD